MLKLKKKLLIFDLDGVLFDSKKNMRLSWDETSTKFNLKIPFSKYFSKIGMPFLEILKSLEIEPKIEIFRFYNCASIKHFAQIKPYKGVIKQLKLLNKNGIKFSIVTSKDSKRTKLLLKKYNIKPNSIHCPNKRLRGKPYPDHLLNSLLKNKVSSKEACFFGDTKIDYTAAKRAKICFIFVRYGYSKYERIFKNSISNFNEIIKCI